MIRHIWNDATAATSVIVTHDQVLVPGVGRAIIVADGEIVGAIVNDAAHAETHYRPHASALNDLEQRHQ